MPKSGDFVDFKVIKQAVSILQVLDRYGITASLKRSGDSLNGCCPLHGGHNPTQFRVNVVKNCFNCFGECKAGGNVLDFVAKKEGVNIRQAALLIQKWFAVDSAAKPNQEPKPERSPPATEPPPSIEKTDAPVVVSDDDSTPNKPLGFVLQKIDSSHPYLQERGLSKEAIETFGLGFCAKGVMAGRIVIPIHNIQGELVGYAGRWPGTPPEDKPKYKLPNGFRKSVEVFNLHRASKISSESPLVIVEGYFGCMAVWQAGVKRVVAVMGSCISAIQAELISQAVTRNGRVVLMFDAGEAGCNGQQQALKMLSPKVFVHTVSLEPDRPQPDQLSQAEILALLK